MSSSQRLTSSLKSQALPPKSPALFELNCRWIGTRRRCCRTRSSVNLTADKNAAIRTAKLPMSESYGYAVRLYITHRAGLTWDRAWNLKISDLHHSLPLKRNLSREVSRAFIFSTFLSSLKSSSESRLAFARSFSLTIKAGRSRMRCSSYDVMEVSGANRREGLAQHGIVPCYKNARVGGRFQGLRSLGKASVPKAPITSC